MRRPLAVRGHGLDEVADALEGKPCPLATLEDARTNLMVALAAKRSWQERRIIAISE